MIQAFVLAVSAQPSHEERGALGADTGEKLPDFFLKEYDECQSTDIDQAIEDATEQSHLENCETKIQTMMKTSTPVKMLDELEARISR